MSFIHREAIGGGRRLRLGVAGPSRSGKTYSSLRIASGIAAHVGGKIFLIDTDNEFSLDYADDFKFEIVDFAPPFTPERYLEAVQYCEAQGAGVIVVDHMSHEQTGQGGVLERQQAVEEELAKKWSTTREKTKSAAWNAAKTIPHGKFVSYVTRIKQPMIFNFRAKDKIKIAKNDAGKQEWIHLGYTPICTEQFDYEMTAMLILPPNSDGYPDQQLSEIRKPLRSVMRLNEQLDEGLGRRLAQWAAGDKGFEPAVIRGAREAATQGTEIYAAYWKSIGAAGRKEVGEQHHEEFKLAANNADKKRAGQSDGSTTDQEGSGATQEEGASVDTSDGTNGQRSNATSAGEAPKVTFAGLVDKFKAATDRDILSAHMELIALLPADQQADARTEAQRNLERLT